MTSEVGMSTVVGVIEVKEGAGSRTEVVGTRSMLERGLRSRAW